MTTPAVPSQPAPAQPASAGPSRVGRREQRRYETRVRHRRLAYVAGGCALLSLTVATVFFVTRGGQQAASYGPPVRTQRTLLLQLQRGNEVVSAVLLSHDAVPGGTDGAAVLLPPEVIVTVPGSGSTTLKSSLLAGRTQPARDAVADLLGVTIDVGWALNLASFGRLVDQIGGLQVDVDVDVAQGSVVALGAGPQRLSGSQASQYATYLAAGEQEPARLVRLQAVLDALFLALPAPDRLPTVLNSLGAGSRPSLPLPALAALLHGLALDTRAQTLQYNLLPVLPIDPGNGATAYRLDTGPTAALVDRLLGPSVPASRRTTSNRVFVSNGVGTPGLGAVVRGVLVKAGFVFVGSRNAPTFGRPKTVILVRDATPAQQQLGLRVARALGVPDTSVQVSDEVGSVADVIAVIGRDYKA